MINVRLVAMGYFSSELDFDKVIKWKTDLFHVINEVQRFALDIRADLSTWGFSDLNLIKNIPTIEQLRRNSNIKVEDITIYIFDVPLEMNYYSRIIDGNRILITYYEIKEILKEANIPLENYLIRLLYVYSLLYLFNSRDQLSMEDEEFFSHDVSKKCIFDMCGRKKEIIYTVITPRICDECKVKLERKIPEESIEKIRKELKGLQQNMYYRFLTFFQKHPIWALLLSGLSALILGIIANILCKWVGIV